MHTVNHQEIVFTKQGRHNESENAYPDEPLQWSRVLNELASGRYAVESQCGYRNRAEISLGRKEFDMVTNGAHTRVNALPATAFAAIVSMPPQ